jgi:hypothetical protein
MESVVRRDDIEQVQSPRCAVLCLFCPPSLHCHMRPTLGKCEVEYCSYFERVGRVCHAVVVFAVAVDSTIPGDVCCSVLLTAWP